MPRITFGIRLLLLLGAIAAGSFALFFRWPQPDFENHFIVSALPTGDELTVLRVTAENPPRLWRLQYKMDSGSWQTVKSFFPGSQGSTQVFLWRQSPASAQDEVVDMRLWVGGQVRQPIVQTDRDRFKPMGEICRGLTLNEVRKDTACWTVDWTDSAGAERLLTFRMATGRQVSVAAGTPSAP